MPFLNEETSEKDKACIDWEPYRMRPNARMPFKPYRWTIDRNRDVFLVSIGYPSPERGSKPKLFGLSWKGTLIRFLANVTLKNEPGSTKNEIFWDFELEIPESLIREKEEIQTILKEAIQAHGYLYGGNYELQYVHISIR